MREIVRYLNGHRSAQELVLLTAQVPRGVARLARGRARHRRFRPALNEAGTAAAAGSEAV